MFGRFFQGLTTLLYPSFCLICKSKLKESHRTLCLCPGCQETVELNRPPFCRVCSRHICDSLPSNTLCHECRQTTYHFDRAWAAVIYNKTMKQLVHCFKYQQKTYLRHYFTELISAFLSQYSVDLSAFEAALPVPLHPTRARERGYNQSLFLLERVARTSDIPVITDNLQRMRNTPNQAALGKKDRWTNIHEAFRIKDPLAFKNKSILIVDDLLTTGATASEIARLLKDAGAKNVGVLTLAIGS